MAKHKITLEDGSKLIITTEDGGVQAAPTMQPQAQPQLQTQPQQQPQQQGFMSKYAPMARAVGKVIPFAPLQAASQIPWEKPAAQKFFKEKVPQSTLNLAKDMAAAVIHPIETGKGLYSLGKGVLQKLSPGVQPDEKMVDGLVEFYKNRYGSVEAIKETAYNDPAGFVADASIFLQGAGAVVGKIGKVGKLGKLARVGRQVGAVGRAIDLPAKMISVPLKATGKALHAAKIAKGKIVSKIRPFAKAVDKPVLKAAQEIGVDLPSSAISKSRVVGLSESLVSKGLFGDRMSRMIDRAANTLKNIADDTIRKTAKAPDVSTAGITMSRGYDNFRKTWFKVKDALYEKATLPKAEKITYITKTGVKRTRTIKKGLIKLKPEQTMQYVNEILENKKAAQSILGKSTDIGYFDNLKKSLSKKVDGNKLKFAIRELNTKLSNINDPVATGNKAQLRKLVTLMSDDLDNAIVAQRPDLAGKIKIANSYYKNGLEQLNSKWGNKITALRNQPDKIFDAVINPATSAEDIPKIIKVVGRENLPQLQSTLLASVFKKATNPQTGLFYPTGLARATNAYGYDKISKILSPAQLKTVKNMAEVSRGLARGAAISGGSQTAFLGRMATEFGLLFTNPMLGIKVVIGDALLSKFVASPTGRKFLTTGLEAGEKVSKTGEKLIKFAPIAEKVGQPLYQLERLKKGY